MLCAARAEVGPLGQSFWVMWDREGRRHDARTTLRPGSREVRMDGPDLEIDSPDLRASLRLGEIAPIESICPSGSGWGWTRKRAGVPIEGTVEVPGKRWEISAHGVDDESAGYHQRHTSWHWSAGVGRAVDGRALAWNLVEGVNDPAEQQRAGDLDRRRAERASPRSPSDGMDGHRPRRRGPPRLRHRVPPRPRRELPPAQLPLPPPLRHLLRLARRRPARRGLRRHGGTRRGLVSRPLQRCSGLGKSKRQPASHSVRWLPWAGMPPASLRIRARWSMFQAAKVVLRLVKSFSGPPEPSSR